MDVEPETLKPEDDRGEPKPAEKAFMLVSLVATLALFGYLAYEAATAPSEGLPTAEILDVKPTGEGGHEVRVRLVNPGGLGLRQATVELDCGDPPPGITLENIPAESHRVATLVCPPGPPPSQASVTSWFEA